MSINELKDLKLLYIEDEANIRKYAMSYFKRIFTKTYEAENATSALEIYKKEKPQIIVTDIKMGEISGLDLIKKIREEDKSCQIIVLSAFLDTKYLLDAIGLNLVKYLTKPLKHDELYLALKECANNLKSNSSTVISFSQNCYFNPIERTLMNNGVCQKLSQKELEFLELLLENKNAVVSYFNIENKIWFDSVMSENALRILVKKLRKKLPSDCLENIARVGYKIKTLT